MRLFDNCLIFSYYMNVDYSELITALKQTANDLNNGCKYEWGHMGRCNAGCLVQNLMNKTDTEVAKMVDYDIAEWSEHAKDYCIGTNQKVNDLFSTLNSFGLSYKDIMHIEYLSDPAILSLMPEHRRHLRKNSPSDVSDYMNCFAQHLEATHQPALN